MSKNIKTYFQDIHYLRKKPPVLLSALLVFFECFYKIVISLKNFLYEKEIFKENKVNAYVICVGNITTGGVGKTPITIELANKISKEKKVAVISRGYGSKLNTKIPQLIKDYNEIKYLNGNICGDEPFQIANKVSNNVIVIICKDRLKACKKAISEYNSEVIIMDDGFSNRKVKKDKTILVIDLKMQFGNKHLLPAGPLREPLYELKRANEIYLTDKGLDDFKNHISGFGKYGKKLYLCKMKPYKIYNSLTNAEIKLKSKEKAVAFCAIGQPEQFFNFAKNYYDIETVTFEDHHKYSSKDISYLIKIARQNGTNIFITTQKDETKIKEFIKKYNDFSFNVLELQNNIEEIN